MDPESEFAIGERADTHQKHATSPHVCSGPPQEFEAAILALVPSGAHKPILALFNGRVTWSAIKHWRKGRRAVPQWARELLRKHFDTIHNHRNAIDRWPVSIGNAAGRIAVLAARAQKERGTSLGAPSPKRISDAR